MRSLLELGLAQGACGMSTGLIYPPCCYAGSEELVALGGVLASAGRPLVVHLRSESDRVVEALSEMIGVAEASGCAVHVSHLKIAGRRNWRRADEVVALFEAESSRRWHVGTGFGVWAAPVARTNVVMLTVAHSEGRTAARFQIGFAF